MGILFSGSDFSLTRWIKQSVIESSVQFAYNNPLETAVLVAAGSTYAFSCLSDEEAQYITEFATQHFDALYVTLEPYVKPVHVGASRICHFFADKFKPVYNASLTFLREVGKEVAPHVQKAELWVRRRFFETQLDWWGNVKEFWHQNWRGDQVYGDPSVLTRWSENHPVKTYINMTGLFAQSSLINRVMPLGKYSFPASMFFSLHQFGETSSYIPID